MPNRCNLSPQATRRWDRNLLFHLLCCSIGFLQPSVGSCWGSPQSPGNSNSKSDELDFAINSTQRDREPSPEEINHWIQKLGAETFSERTHAQTALERIGVRALDQLHQACYDSDPQIASQARFMVQSNQFNWAWDSDRFNVRRILQNYSSAELHNKTGFIDQLFQLDNDEGVAPLCRLVRYEPQGCLAKHAALRLMNGKPRFGQSAADRKQLILGLVSGAHSTAGQWIQLAMSPTAGSAADFPVDRWESMIQSEKDLLLNKSMDTSVSGITALRKWVAGELASVPELRHRALAIAKSIQEPLFAEPASLPGLRPNNDFAASKFSHWNMQPIDYATWAISVRLPELVQEQHARLDPATTLANPLFSYLLAESFLLEEKRDIAESTAKLASERIVVKADGTKADADKLKQPNPLLDSLVFRSSSAAFERSNVARSLIDRGRFDWAERELHTALEGHDDSPDLATSINLTYLSDLLHEQQRDEEAAQVLLKFTTRFENEPLFKSQIIDQFVDALPSNHYLYRGEHLARTHKPDEARASYLKSIELSLDNVDAIIGLYELPENESQKSEREKIQQRVINDLRGKIDSMEKQIRLVNARFLDSEQNALANDMNTLAWLLTRTDSNREEALFLSRKACAMAPERAAYLDTLAHCYFALERTDEAVKHQRRAVELQPFKPSLVQALKRFEEESASKK